MRRALTVLVFLLCVAVSRAATASFPNVGAMSYHWQTSATNPGLVEIYADAVTEPDWAGNYRDLKLQISVGNDSSFPGNYTTGLRPGEYGTVTAGVQFWVRVCWHATDVSPNVYGPHGTDAPPPVYAAKFSIPANNTDHPITYSTSNGGTFTQQPGAGATSYTVGGLASNTPITLTETTSGVSLGSGGVWESSPSGSYSREVGSATPVQTNGASPQTPTATPATSPTAATSSGAAPAPSTISGDVSLDAPVWSPKTDVNTGTPPGSSTSDVTIQALREATDKQVGAQKAAADQITNAINSASSSQSSRDATRDGKIDTTNTKIDSVYARLGEVNSGIGSVNSHLNTLITDVQAAGPAVTPFGDPRTGEPPLVLNDPITKAVSKLPSAPTFSSLNSASSISVSLSIPKLSGGTFDFTKSIDFGAAPYAAPIAIFRTILLVVLTLVFFLASFFTVRGAFAGK